MICSKCGKERMFNGKICNLCKNDNFKDNNKNSIVFIIVLLLFFLVWKCSCSKSDNEIQQQYQQQTEQDNEHSKIVALTAAQECVTERLKSPSSADFPWGSECVTKISDNTYVINSYVDSQNSYGAMIRTNFTCQITLTGNESYTCDDIQLFEQ